MLKFDRSTLSPVKSSSYHNRSYHVRGIVKSPWPPQHNSACQKIYIVQTDGTIVTEINHRPQTNITWSPDGQWLACESIAEGYSDIEIVSTMGGQRRLLMHDKADDRTPSWSRDGKWIYFQSCEGGRQDHENCARRQVII